MIPPRFRPPRRFATTACAAIAATGISATAGTIPTHISVDPEAAADIAFYEVFGLPEPGTLGPTTYATRWGTECVDFLGDTFSAKGTGVIPMCEEVAAPPCRTRYWRDAEGVHAGCALPRHPPNVTTAEVSHGNSDHSIPVAGGRYAGDRAHGRDLGRNFGYIYGARSNHKRRDHGVLAVKPGPQISETTPTDGPKPATVPLPGSAALLLSAVGGMIVARRAAA